MQIKDSRTTQAVNKGGRPTKLTEEFLRVTEEILLDSAEDLEKAREQGKSIDFRESRTLKVIINTDYDLVDSINQKLKPADRISLSTFEKWKAMAQKPSDVEKLPQLAQRFLRVIKKALTIQKEGLFLALLTSEQGWQRFAWIIERKFKEWRKKHKREQSIPCGRVCVMSDFSSPK